MVLNIVFAGGEHATNLIDNLYSPQMVEKNKNKHERTN